MIGNDTFLTQIDGLVPSSPTAIQLAQLTAGLETTPVTTVNLLSDLPDPALNKGRVFFVIAINSYRTSNGSTWISNTDSSLSYSAFAIGLNNVGQLGDGTTVNKSSPVSVIGGFTWKQVSTGEGVTIDNFYGIDKNGSVWSWGANQYGEIGDGTTKSKYSPTSLVSPFNSWTWKQIKGGYLTSLALKSDGTFWSWGGGLNGEHGDGTNTSKTSPVSLIAPFNSWTWKQLNGDYTVMVIKSDDTLWSWGRNTYGQLGDGTTVSKTSPVSLIAPFNSWTWKQCDTRKEAVAAIKSDDTLWTWGRNSFGQLGDGTAVDKSSPVSLVSPFNSWTWKQVSLGAYYALAIKSDDTLWGVGYNQYGQLGDNSSGTSYSSPVSVVGGFTWKQVSASVANSHSAAIRSDDTLWGWGNNDYGQVGDGIVGGSKLSPVSLMSPFNSYTWKDVSLLDTTAIMLRKSGF